MLVKCAILAYTLGMLFAALIVSVFSMNTNGLHSGEVPENAATYRINFPNDATDYYGGILLNEEWVKPGDVLQPVMKRVEVVFDTPWEPQEHVSALLNKIAFSYETPALRTKRLQEGWEKAGYVFIEVMEEGKKCQRPVLKQELELAQRARAMASGLESQWSAKEGENAASLPETALPEPGPGFVRLWGGHFLLGAAGLVLIGLAVKFLILRG